MPKLTRFLSLVWLAALSSSLPVVLLARSPLAARLGHTDPAKYNHSLSHESAGDMACMLLLVPPMAMDINLNFMHRCQITPGNSIGGRRFNELSAAEPRVQATAIPSIGRKGYDGVAMAIVINYA